MVEIIPSFTQSNIPLFIKQFKNAQPYSHIIIDDALESNMATLLQDEIMNVNIENFDRYDNPFEQKYTLRDKYNFPNHLSNLFATFESSEFVNYLSAITQSELLLDPTRNFWGVHKYKSGDKLDIHLDASYHPITLDKKHITLGLYLSSNWKSEYGCELELWDSCMDENSFLKHKLVGCVTKVAPLFNRMILFENGPNSWHGNPEPCECPSDAFRIFVTISYMIKSHDILNKRTKALFIARPNDPIDTIKDELRLLRSDPVKYKEIYRMNMN